MLTPLQKQTAQAIVNLFETSSARGDYGAVTVIAGDTGHLSFGRSQTTLGSGNLHALLQRYCDNAGARFGPRLTPWLQRVEQRDTTLDHELRIHVRDLGDRNPATDEINRFIDREFPKNGINIAFRQVEVYVKNLQHGEQKLDQKDLAQAAAAGAASVQQAPKPPAAP